MRTMLTVMLALVVLGCAGNEPQADAADTTPPADAGATQAAPAAPSTPPKTAVSPAPPPPPAREVDPGVAVVREYTQMFYRGELDLLHQKFTQEMREEHLTLPQLSALHEQVLRDFGKETRVIAEDSQRNEDYRAFVRWARFDKTEEVIEVQWILRSTNDEIAGFFVRPARRKVDVQGQ